MDGYGLSDAWHFVAQGWNEVIVIDRCANGKQFEEIRKILAIEGTGGHTLVKCSSTIFVKCFSF